MLFLQKAQLIHDERFHPDILSLPLQDRAKHIVLHLTKYLGKLYAHNDKEIIFSDILICCLALGNTLKKVLNFQEIENHINFEAFIYHYAISLGKMAKSCEAMDHLEDYPVHTTLLNEVNNILSITINYLNAADFDFNDLIKIRWDNIETKDFLFDN